MNQWKRISSALSSFLTGAAELTPEQKVKLEQMEKDCTALLGAKKDNGRSSSSTSKSSPPRQTV
jgi:hypothetical protein